MAEVDLLDQPTPKITHTTPNPDEIEDKAIKHWQEFSGRLGTSAIWTTLYKNTNETSRYITITFNQSLRYRFDEKTLKALVKQGFKRVVETIKFQWQKNELRIVLIPEYSEVGNFHYHGIITGFNRFHLAFLKRHFAQNIGYVNVQVPKNVSYVFRYVTKDVANGDIEYDDIIKNCIFSKKLN